MSDEISPAAVLVRATCCYSESRDVPNGHSRVIPLGGDSTIPPRSSEVSRWTPVHSLTMSVVSLRS